MTTLSYDIHKSQRIPTKEEVDALLDYLLEVNLILKMEGLTYTNYEIKKFAFSVMWYLKPSNVDSSSHKFKDIIHLISRIRDRVKPTESTPLSILMNEAKEHCIECLKG